MIYSVDSLGAVRYFDVLKAELPGSFSFGVLMGFFDKKNLTALDVIAWGIQRQPRVHGCWSKDHKFYEKDIKLAIRRAEQVREIGVTPYSPFLEYKSIEGGALEAFKRIRKAVPDLPLVNCGGARIPFARHETHYRPGRKVPRGDIASTDGIDHMTINDEQYDRDARDAHTQSSWCFHNNGRTVNGPALPVKKRKNWTTVKQFRAQVALLRR